MNRPRRKDMVVRFVALACREALVAFVNDSARWSKAELARWLVTSYGPIVRVAPARHGRGSGAALDWQRARDVVAEARDTALVLMRRATTADMSADALESASRGDVVPCVDARGEEGWYPVAGPRMRLVDRVRSLWAVDYLCNTSDYVRALGFCWVCGAARFDRSSRERGACAYHGGARIEVVWSARFGRVYRSVARGGRTGTDG